ncbi:hypothetical protein ACJX0J_017031, partial [Zea mays]
TASKAIALLHGGLVDEGLRLIHGVLHQYNIRQILVFGLYRLTSCHDVPRKRFILYIHNMFTLISLDGQ